MSPEEPAQRAGIIEMVIRTPKLLQTLQGRADELGEVLARFKARREAMQAWKSIASATLYLPSNFAIR